MSRSEFQPIAIIGYGCLFPPNSYDAQTYWENLISGKSGISTPPPERWTWERYYSADRSAEDKTYCNLGGFIKDYRFPYAKFGLSENDLPKFNRTQLMILDATLQAVEMSGYGREDLQELTTGLFVGNMLGDEFLADYSMGFRAREVFRHIRLSEKFSALPIGQQKYIERGFFDTIRQRFPIPEDVDVVNAFQGNLAKSVGNYLGLSGTLLVCDAACASGLLIVDVAVRYLQDRSHDLVLACGVMGNMSVTGNVSFAKIGGLSETHSAPLDASANGLIPGEGAGIVILKRLEDAIGAGDNIRGVIRGIASRCDGKGKAIYAPSSTGQVAAMSRSLELAGLRPEELDHVETHATATPTGDSVEIESLKQLYAERGCERRSVSLGSVKSQIGHTFPAAGMANLIKILLSFEHGILPPTHGYKASPSKMGLQDSPFYVNTEERDWPVRDEHQPRRAGANAFGFGGINTNICVEEYHREYHEHLSRRLQSAAPSATKSLNVAIVGMGCVTEHARNAGEYGSRDKTALAGFPKDRWHQHAKAIYDPQGTWRGSAIEDLDFPWKKYRIPPQVLPELDRSQLMAIMAAGEAMEDYGQDPDDRRETGVFIGAFGGLEAGLSRNLRVRLVEFEEILKEVPEFNALEEPVREALVSAYTSEVKSYVPSTKENALPGYMDNIMGGRIGNLFDLRNTNMMVDNDTCSFGAALDIAIKHLAQGDCETALVGGVHANLAPEFTHLVYRLQDETGTGMELIPGEGAAFFVLKKLEDVQDQDEVYAVITDVSRAKDDSPAVRPGEPFYFGADGAFRTLESIKALQGGESAAGKEPELTRLTVNLPSIMGHGDSYRFSIYSLEAVRRSDRATLVESRNCGRAEVHSQLPLSCYAWGATLPELLEKLNQLMCDVAKEAGPLWSAPTMGPQAKNYRLGITYSTREELESKIRLILRLVSQYPAHATQSDQRWIPATEGEPRDVQAAC